MARIHDFPDGSPGVWRFSRISSFHNPDDACVATREINNLQAPFRKGFRNPLQSNLWIRSPLR